MTDTHSPTDVIAGAFMVKHDGEEVLALAESVDDLDGEDFRSATRADVQAAGYVVEDDGTIHPDFSDAEPVGHVGDGETVAVKERRPAKRRRGTVTDRLRREAADAEAPAPSDG